MSTKKLRHMFSGLLHAIMIFFVLLGSLSLPANVQALGIAIEVNTSLDNSPPFDGLCSLREAIHNANNNNQFFPDCSTGFSDDAIFFSDALGTATITLTSSLSAIKDPAGLTINGGNDITISGANLHQVFSVNPTGYLILDSLKIKNGKSSVTNIGGAIWNAGKLEIKNSYLSNNSATSGGAIFNGVAQLTIINTNFYNNKASEGGAINNEGGQVVIQGGFFSDNSAANAGGAIKNVFAPSGPGTSLNITGTSFSLNTSRYGAGIYNARFAQLNLTDTEILKNTAFITGGGIYNLGIMSVNASDISANSAKTGGGVYNEPGLETYDNINVNIVGSNLQRNGADLGAGIYNLQGGLSLTSTKIWESKGTGLYNYGGNVMISDGTFSSNQGHAIYNHGEDDWFFLASLRVEDSNISDNSGMGIYNNFGKSNVFTTTFQKNGSSAVYNIKQSVVTIDKSTLLDNNSKYGGGIYNDDSDLHVHNTTVYGNTAIQGGGLYNNGRAYVLNSTFSGNSAEAYDGVLNLAELALYNTIIAKSGGLGIDCTNAPGGVIAGNNNLIESTGQAACDLVNGVDNNIIGFSPNFVAFTGSPAYLTIDSNSPALDAGDDAQCFMLLNQSQNGVTRPQGAHCDIGSYELPAGEIKK